MTKATPNKIIDGLNDALAMVGGEAKPYRYMERATREMDKRIAAALDERPPRFSFLENRKSQEP
jgi:hypothetical protein